MATLSRSDLEFVLEQIKISEQHASGADLLGLLPNSLAMLGLRTVDGSYNNVVPGQEYYGAADQPFVLSTDQIFRNEGDDTAFSGTLTNNNYASSGSVADADPRIISNLIADQTITNPAAVEAFVTAGLGILADGTQIDPVTLLPYASGTLLDLDGLAIPAGVTLFIPNVSPDEGLSAPFNSWFTFFGQFFDHGLDLVNKGGNGTVFIPLEGDDPLRAGADGIFGTLDDLSDENAFMAVTRASNITTTPGVDGILGTADDVHLHNNQTTPFVDQNQTYTSHPSHQVFLREYVLDGSGRPVATGKLLDNATNGGLPTWAEIKAQAASLLGIALTDADVNNLPMVRTDQYGNFIPDPTTGTAQLITGAGTDGLLNTADDLVVAGNLTTPVDSFAAGALRTNHAFLDDIAHSAAPRGSDGAMKLADGDDVINGDRNGNGVIDGSEIPVVAGTYDDELLDRHFITGDGRGNENIGLTAVHHIFHSEHNRQVAEVKSNLVADAIASGDTTFLNEWLLTDVASVPPDVSTLVWDGERLFQVARFATEMQYQHLVFEEFARKVQPNVDAFLQYDNTLNPAIAAEFAHTVYRFGHTMLTETIDRLDPNFVSSDIGLVQAFLNPVAFDNDGALTASEAAGAVVRGMTRQVGNQIDEFVTEALRNNLLGLPLDLAAINIARGRDTGVPSLNAARLDFYTGTGDAQLKPYTSWADLAINLTHEASIINFIAAYGKHAAITTLATSAAERREAAMLLVLGDGDDSDGVTIGGVVYNDRFEFLNSTGAWANNAGLPKDVDGVSTTGLGDVDLWIGGLAERHMPFGGMLGSTFNFVFETQLEALQDHDRFYYLGRLAGLNFLSEMENNTFAKLIMANTNTTHLAADVFSTPTWILEVDQSKQYNPAAGVDPNADPVGGSPILPLVIRDDPNTSDLDTNYLRYTGPDHVVLGGTEGNDILIASEGDDTIWGDGGNDRIEGGTGNDQIEGGAGDDIITDIGGDDVIKGGAGNDVIHGGQGLNLIIGGDGKDFIITGEDITETFAGLGDDFIYGAKTNLASLGNEGNDWIEIGTQDGAPGDNFDPLKRDLVKGHDVFLGGGGFDEMLGEGGDDIFVGSEGEDHFDGSSGFDWTTYKDDQYGLSIDMTINDFIEPPATPSNAGILDRFAFVEGLSGSQFADILRGDNQQAAGLLLAGANGSVLDAEGIALITNLQSLLGVGVTTFGAGNILLGGGGSDIIEGRAGNDIIDGNRWLNVRISVRANIDGSGPEIGTADSMVQLIPDVLAGVINPGQLVIQREILQTSDNAVDTAVFSAPIANYTITVGFDGTTTVVDNRVGAVTDGTDTLHGIERLQFTDQTFILPSGAGLNAAPTGQLVISDNTPAANQLLTVSNAAIADADGITAGSFTYLWQVELNAGTGVFTDIVVDVGGNPSLAHGPEFRVPAVLDGLAIRVRAVYKDGDGTLEQVFSAPTDPVSGTIAITPTAAPPTETIVDSAGNGVHFIRGDLDFILQQIKTAEAHSGAYGTPAQALSELLPNSRVPFGLRTVDGTYNNLLPGQTTFGASDENFPLLLTQVFRNEGDDTGGGITNNNYALTGPGASVVDADPRLISNLIVDQTITNPAAVQNYVDAGLGVLDGAGVLHYVLPDGGMGAVVPGGVTLGTPNTTPDAGLSAGFNSWFTFFGQFFDHGLDLVDKGDNGIVYIPLAADDPLRVAGPDGIVGNGDEIAADQAFMLMSRATNSYVAAGVDGVFGTADDVHLHNNETTPFVDQNQTYTSHASHQVFLREYVLNGAGDPVATGNLLDGAAGGIGNWAEVKAQAASMLGIQLVDTDIFNVPLLATDQYGKFIPGPNGFAQFVTTTGLVEANPADNGGLGTLVPANGVRSGHAFLNDIAHNAAPNAGLTADADNVVNTGVQPAGTYDDELLDKHFITGDGRGNENIGLTTVHFVFHAEHNRLAEHIKEVALASNDLAFLNQWLLTPLVSLPASVGDIDPLNWNGERIFQAARFGTEMQYQHLVFEEFARKIQPQVDIFFAPTQVYDTAINPAIVAEFAHVVYRFGHSLLTDTIDRYDADFSLVGASTEQITLIDAFLNPLEFTASGVNDTEAAGAIVRGVTRQVGNEIDEFISDALRNNLVGLPLDLAAINIARGRDAGVPSFNDARAEFFAMTGDTQLKPYESWYDLGANLKHAASLVNFVAAYGTHSSITSAGALVDKRAAAYALVYGANGMDGIAGTADDVAAGSVPSDRLDFMNSVGAWANTAARPKDVDGVTNTGLGNVDLWIGGLAEKQMPFGGLLGSTFNFVFENQMEKLQDGDRFYYLERTAGMNFLSELEANSFAKLIMANTTATHLPGDVFTTPTYTLEVDATVQFTGLGSGRDDPTGGTTLNPLVLRNDPDSVNPNPNYLKYSGPDHVVLGGTSGDDKIISSIGDDTLYGDGGNDRLEGGDGNDILLGGDGDDIITDIGGDDLIQGQDGNDAIQGGNGINLIIAGFGNDFVVTGEDASEGFGGFGNDFLLGARANEFIFGNEGDDWIEAGMVDGSAGDNFDPFARDLVRGNDVFFGNGLTDRMDGEGGDDIMIGNGGDGDRYEGFSGFDWANFKTATVGQLVDLTLVAFNETPIPISATSILARFINVEGLSGSAHDDFLRGDNVVAAGILAAGAYGSVLENISLIDGLSTFLNTMLNQTVTSFGDGNIILGGAGSDLLEGRGGNDLIDGDAWLNVRIGGVDIHGATITADTMVDLQARVFAGEINPGDLHIVRELLISPTPDYDTALFTGALLDAGGNANYAIAVNGVDQDVTVPFTINIGDVVTVTDLVGLDGIDTVRHVERLQFSDVALSIDGTNNNPVGLLTLDSPPVEDGVVTVLTTGITDVDNITGANPGGVVTGPFSLFWQREIAPGIWEDILVDGSPAPVRATGPTYTPTDAEAGLNLRVRGMYIDATGVLETVFSAPTLVQALDDAPIGIVSIPDGTPTETLAIIANPAFTDADGMINAVLTYSWQQANNTGVGGGSAGFTTVATGSSFAPGAAQVNREIRVIVSYTDDQGFLNTLTSAPTIVTGDYFAAAAGGQVLTGNEGQDVVYGGGGADVISTAGQDDFVDGGTGNDNIQTGDGNDFIVHNVGDGADVVDGGAGIDLLLIDGGGGTNVLTVVFNGSALSSIAGGALSNVEAVMADLSGGVDTLSYNGTGAGVSVNVNLATQTASGFTLTTPIDDTMESLADVNDLIPAISGIENVTGGAGNDSLTGDALANVLNGNGGDDVITGGDGDDTLLGNLGNDRFVALAFSGVDDGDDTINGGPGTDTYDLSATVEAATVTTTSATSAAIGNDSLIGVENFIGSQGADSLTGAAGANNIDGQGGSDTIAGGAGVDVLAGGADNDTFNYAIGEGADQVDGGSGSDTLAITGGGAAEILDVIFNGSSITNFEGGTLTGVENVTVNLGAGGDTLSYTGTTVSVSVNLQTGTASGLASLAGVENATGGSGADNLVGSAGVSNVLNGGGGDDIFVVQDAGDTVVEAGLLTGGTDTVQSTITYTITDVDVENLTLLGSANINGTGNASANVITGNSGNNTLGGLGGNDTINAGAGDDTIAYTIGGGADTIDGGADTDTLAITGTAAANTLNVTVVGGVLSALGSGSVTGVETATVDLLGGSDTISFASTTEAISVDLGTGLASGGFASLFGVENATGGSNADLLVGSAGVSNVLTGGSGDDIFVVQDSGDTVSELNGLVGGTDTVQSSATHAITDADVENLTLTGAGNINGTGNVSANVILGNSGDNTLSGLGGTDELNGGDGADILVGGGGIDMLIGGLGNDTFDFNIFNESGVGIGNNDVIADFEGAGAAVGDIIDLSTMDAVGGPGDQAFSSTLLFGATPFTASGQLRIVELAGDTFVQANINGNPTTIEFEIRLAGVTGLTAADFIL